jgi:uroporphyrinogen-III synthase
VSSAEAFQPDPDRRPLAGRVVLVTRPAAQAAATVDAIQAAGAHAWCLPTLAITAPGAPHAVAHAIAALRGAAFAIFTSANAVDGAIAFGLDRAALASADRVLAAVGAGTAAALHARGLVDTVDAVLVPEAGSDSEALLAHPRFASVAGLGGVVFTGDDARPWLVDTLRARGATVEVAATYARGCPPPVDAATEAALAAAPLDAVTTASSEGLRHLHAMVGARALARLRALPHVVTHSRIAAAARAAGVSGPVAIADDARDGTVRALVGILADSPPVPPPPS